MNRVFFESLIFLTILFVVFLLYIPTESTADTINCSPSVPDCFGTNRDDLIHTSYYSKSTNIYAGAGDDVIVILSAWSQAIYGGEGDDMIFAGGGDDRIFGGFNDDRIDGGFGDDDIYDEEGDDNIAGGWGSDLIYGDHDNDHFRFMGSDKIFGGYGEDVIFVNRGQGFGMTRDFNTDYVECGAGFYDRAIIGSSDGDIAEPNCELITNLDH